MLHSGVVGHHLYVLQMVDISNIWDDNLELDAILCGVFDNVYYSVARI